MATKKVVFEIEIKGNKQVFELQKQIKQLKKELEKTDDPTVAEQLLNDLAKLESELKKARANAKLAQSEFEAKDQTIGSYKRLSAQLFVARERFKELAASGKASNKELQQAQREALQLQNRLKAIDAATGSFGRNVGNYAGSLKGLFGSLRETIRTSRLLNTIPNIFNLALNAIEKVRRGVELYNETFDQNYLISKQVEAATGSLIGEYVKERAQLDGLTKVAGNENESKERRKAAVDALQQQYPDYFKNLDRENISVTDLAAGYEAARNSIETVLKAKIRAQIIEQQLADAVQKTLDAQKAQTQAQIQGALQGFDVQGLLLKGYANLQSEQADIAAKTATDAAANIEQVDKALDGVFSALKSAVTDASGAFDASDANIKALGEATRKEAAKTTSDLEKENDKRLKAIEQLNKDLQQLEQQRITGFKDLQNELKQAVVDAIEDEGEKAVAQEKLNFEFRKAERNKQFNDLVALIEQQEQRIIEALGEGSEELVSFREETREKLVQIESQYNAITEQDAIAHQLRLKEIEAQVQGQRTQQDAQFAADRIEAQQAYLSELERGLEFTLSQINEQLANGEITAAQAIAAELNARRLGAEEQIAIITETLDRESSLTAQQYSDLIQQRQLLSQQLAEIEKQDADRRLKAITDTVSFVLETTQQGITALSGLFDAITANEIKQTDEAIASRQRNIENLQESLNNATGFEKEFLQQKLERETFAAEQLTKEKERIEKAAAKRNKAIGIIQAIVNTALGITQALASLPPPASFITAAITGALGAVQIATIAAQPLAKGGYTGSGAGSPDKTGFKPAGIVHEGEWVAPKWMVQSSNFAPIIESLEASRTRGFAGGGFTSAPLVPSVSSSVTSVPQMFSKFEGLIGALDKKTDAINSRIDRQEVVFTPNTQKAIDQDEKDRKNIKVLSTL